jgi:hypothetical protein
VKWTILMLLALVSRIETSAHGQTVRGVVLDSLTGAPVRDALVMLISEEGQTHARSLSVDGGAYAVTAPTAGRYVVRAKRVGFRPVQSESFDIAEGEVRTHIVLAPTVRVTLPSVTIRANRHCRMKPGAGAEAFALWEEVRTALYQTSLAQRGDLYQTIARRWARELDTLARHVRADSSWTIQGMAQRPFVAVSMEKLDQVGYIERTADNHWLFYAPDAEVLLSERFLSTHCFSVVRGDHGLVGLAFEPVKKRKVADITGVLWLDAESAELRYLEFKYTKLPWRISASRVGGRVEFEQLASGLWIVRRWHVRAPRMAIEHNVFRLGRATHFRTSERFISLIEHGGEVIDTRQRLNLSWHLTSGSAGSVGAAP